MDSTKLNEAVEYIWSATLDPVYRNPAVPKKMVNQTKHAEKIIRSFNRVGDLVKYMNRFKPGNAPASAVAEMRNAGIPTFEDFYDKFLQKFGAYEHDRTRLTDFVVGEVYPTSDLVNFAELYDPRAGGIFTIGPDDNLEAIFLKATLDGTGDYPNEWLKLARSSSTTCRARSPKALFGKSSAKITN